MLSLLIPVFFLYRPPASTESAAQDHCPADSHNAHQKQCVPDVKQVYCDFDYFEVGITGE